ncbi:amino acid ABC transporter permease [Gordonia sp. (in: high G+C Gram-positive bacteria)]|uniref:amino acid ABC transporter permease n=1 Tax=Gordonia sp. (in: high G+C Gram-positive bacteria) TaxID=84139 RepID=UPI0016AA9F2E|nr:amino acid ABC transporter permease [Gordonia sp. (in: high G+C Gram-positive bacteria)]NLG46623.1 amino acid ABC transporter permease [Gordonia sp. (in: high G+C Gram-positive bacteria)]
MTVTDNAANRDAAEPEPIQAVPLKHPGQWIAGAVILILVGLFIYGAATNDAYRWDTYAKYLFEERILSGVGYTLALTVLAMIAGVVLGVIVAVMRMSPNKVLSATAWVYLWVFRGTPVFVQLVLWGLVGSLYKVISIGVPFGPTFVQIDIQQLSLEYVFVLAVIGLALNEAAYMAEIVRAGISSVGEGQMEASVALGMSWWQTMRRTVLPQAMRVIIPPTGNEVISMLKTTSLVLAVPFSLELYGRSRDISGVNFQPIPMLLVASTWYLVITSVLMVGQHYVEKHYAKGASRQLTDGQLEALAAANKTIVEEGK